jgi:hypothetical protein
VSADSSGNVWVSDTNNRRVLRFPSNSKVANLVIGQPNFNTTDGSLACSTPNPSMSQLCLPVIARVHPTTGDLYVLDQGKVVVLRDCGIGDSLIDTCSSDTYLVLKVVQMMHLLGEYWCSMPLLPMG